MIKMSEEKIREMCNDIYEGGEWQPMIDYITNLQNQNNQMSLLLERISKFIPLHYPETLSEIQNFLNKIEHND